MAALQECNVLNSVMVIVKLKIVVLNSCRDTVHMCGLRGYKTAEGQS